MADVKKQGQTAVKKAAGKGANAPASAKKTKSGGNAMTASAMEGMDSAPLPESTPNPGEPGFHWGM